MTDESKDCPKCGSHMALMDNGEWWCVDGTVFGKCDGPDSNPVDKQTSIEQRLEAYAKYSTACVEKGGSDECGFGDWVVSTASERDEGDPVAMWVASREDADAIAMGLKLYAECIKEELKTEDAVLEVAAVIMRLSKTAPRGVGHE